MTVEKKISLRIITLMLLCVANNDAVNIETHENPSDYLTVKLNRARSNALDDKN